VRLHRPPWRCRHRPSQHLNRSDYRRAPFGRTPKAGATWMAVASWSATAIIRKLAGAAIVRFFDLMTDDLAFYINLQSLAFEASVTPFRNRAAYKRAKLLDAVK
jgi:hypothetical protein